MLLPKPLDDIAAADIRSLVENKVKEGDRLEYKENLPKANDDERVKFLCTVASLANSPGGDIVIGIGERRDGNRKTGDPLDVLDARIEGRIDLNSQVEVRGD